MVNNTRKFNRNILPDNLERVLFRRMDPIVNSLKRQANTICRNHVSEEYIHKAFNNFKWGYYYKQDNKVVGFCLWKENKEIMKISKNDFKYMYVLLVCAQQTDYKLGKIMFFDMERFGLVQNVNTIKLQPLNTDIVPYYETLGYKIVSDNKFFFMEKDIILFHVNKKVHNSKTRKQKATGDGVFRTNIHIINNNQQALDYPII